MKKFLVMIGAVALMLSLSTAGEKCGGMEKAKDMKCQAGKCGSADKEKMKVPAKGKSGDAAKCGGDTKEKKVPAKGKCGQGKCGS